METLVLHTELASFASASRHYHLRLFATGSAAVKYAYIPGLETGHSVKNICMLFICEIFFS